MKLVWDGPKTSRLTIGKVYNTLICACMRRGNFVALPLEIDEDRDNDDGNCLYNGDLIEANGDTSSLRFCILSCIILFFFFTSFVL